MRRDGVRAAVHGDEGKYGGVAHSCVPEFHSDLADDGGLSGDAMAQELTGVPCGDEDREHHAGAKHKEDQPEHQAQLTLWMAGHGASVAKAGRKAMRFVLVNQGLVVLTGP